MALPPRPAERGEADRAHLPWERAASGRGASGRGASDEFFKPIHLVNELVTPEVEYRTWKEFVDLVYDVQDEFCACIAAAVLRDSQARHVSPVRGGEYFPLSLALVRERGPDIMMRLTKQQGLFWCQVVSHFVCSHALRAAAIYDDVRSALGGRTEALGGGRPGALDGGRTEALTSIMQQEVCHTFSGAMPFSIYTLCSGFVSTLLVKNFTFFDDHCLTAFSHRQFEHMLLTLCMGLHPRLGRRSPLLPLDADLLRAVCAGLCASQLQKHIVFHTQEQWLY
jgi:hypothetical protein